MDTKLAALPKGYSWVKDPQIRVITPLGYRIERVKRRRIPVTGETGRISSDDWLARHDRFLGALKEGGKPGDFVDWGGGNYPPASIGSAIMADKRWLWLPTYGGVIRLADEPSTLEEKGLGEFKPGDFFLSVRRCRLYGFSSFQHDLWGGRVNVRMPDGLVTLADKAARVRLGVEGGGV